MLIHISAVCRYYYAEDYPLSTSRYLPGAEATNPNVKLKDSVPDFLHLLSFLTQPPTDRFLLHLLALLPALSTDIYYLQSIVKGHHRN